MGSRVFGVVLADGRYYDRVVDSFVVDLDVQRRLANRLEHSNVVTPSAVSIIYYSGCRSFLTPVVRSSALQGVGIFQELSATTIISARNILQITSTVFHFVNCVFMGVGLRC